MFYTFVSELNEVFSPRVLPQVSLFEKGAEYDKYRRCDQT